jgi:hypothetical protein
MLLRAPFAALATWRGLGERALARRLSLQSSCKVAVCRHPWTDPRGSRLGRLGCAFLSSGGD